MVNLIDVYKNTKNHTLPIANIIINDYEIIFYTNKLIKTKQKVVILYLEF